MLNANDWLSNYSRVARPENKYYYPGFTLGGPVKLPFTDFNKKRDKLFFFTGFQYFRQVLDTGLLRATSISRASEWRIFNAAYTYTFGSVARNKLAGGLLNSCQVSGITQLQSGVNLTGQRGQTFSLAPNGFKIPGTTYNVSATSLLRTPVANDTVQNFLFVNRGRGRTSGNWSFEEMALAAEVGFSEAGQPRSGMGVDAADVFASGYQDLFVANVDQEMFSLYRNQKNEVFRDVAQANGVAQATRLLSGWGLKFFDYDNDGSVDLILANGHPDDMVESYSPAVKYREPLLLFHQENGKLRNVSDDAGPAFRKSYAARGLAVGDFNNDSLLDVLIGVNGGAPVLLKNQSARENHWVGLKLEGVNCNRDGIGARIRWSTGGLIRSRLKNSGGSYLSAHDPREVLGVATVSKVDWVEVTWPRPSGKVQRIDNPPIGRYMRVTES